MTDATASLGAETDGSGQLTNINGVLLIQGI